MASATLSQLPTTLSERFVSDEQFRVPATFEEYLEFADRCEYRVEYSNGNIIAMGTPTDTHELICGNAVWALKNILFDNLDFKIYGSNLGLLIQPDAHYKPDAVVLNSEPEFMFHKLKKRTVKSIINPFAVVEIFSDGTIKYDLTEKLPNYKICPSLQYIIYIHQHTPLVTVYTRSEFPNRWLTEDFTHADDSFLFAGRELSLKNLYHQVTFMGKSPHPAK